MSKKIQNGSKKVEKAKQMINNKKKKKYIYIYILKK